MTETLIDPSQTEAAILQDTAVADTTQQQPPQRPDRAVKVRLLVDGEHGPVNTVIELPSAQAKALVASGAADSDKAAVAYALSLTH